MEHRQGKGGMAPVGKAAAMGGGRQPSVSLVIQGGDTGGSVVWIWVLGYVLRDDEDGVEHPCGVSMSDNG